jgi:hypothetical protein
LITATDFLLLLLATPQPEIDDTKTKQRAGTLLMSSPPKQFSDACCKVLSMELGIRAR